MADRTVNPDYELPDALELTSPEQYRALFEETRSDILSLLLDRAATTSELAAALGKPKGTVGHHLKVLSEAGLVHVVRTERVRALEARYYGRTARTFYFHRVGAAAGWPQRVMMRATAELDAVPEERRHEIDANVRYARISADRAQEWTNRMGELLVEFGAQPREGQTTYGLVYALYPTTRPPIRDRPVDESTEVRDGGDKAQTPAGGGIGQDAPR